VFRGTEDQRKGSLLPDKEWSAATQLDGKHNETTPGQMEEGARAANACAKKENKFRKKNSKPMERGNQELTNNKIKTDRRLMLSRQVPERRRRIKEVLWGQRGNKKVTVQGKYQELRKSRGGKPRGNRLH